MTFVCTGKECLDCPLKDCVRELCEKDGEFIHVIVKANRNEYWREYYRKNRERIREYQREYARRRRNDSTREG